MYPIYEKWQTQPTITSVAETNFPIWNIHFPAVTICSNNKVVQERINKLLNKQPWKNISQADELFENYLRTAIAATVMFNVEPAELAELSDETKKILDTYKKNFTSILQRVKL